MARVIVARASTINGSTAPMTSADIQQNIERQTDGSGRTATAALANGVPNQLISFAIGNDQYGVDIMAVREIKGWTTITPLPSQPEFVRGVVNLRGVIVPIIDLRCRFGQGQTEATALHIMIIVEIASNWVGLLADRVLDIVPLDAVQVQPVPRVTATSRTEFLSGLVTIEGAMIALIDLPNLIPPSLEPALRNAAVQ